MPREVFGRNAPPARIAIGYPNRWSLAVNNLGFRTVAHILGECRGVHRERFYLPAGGLPLMPGSVVTEPSRARLAAMDLVLLSLSFEGDAAHVPAMLEASGLPPLASERRPGQPLVVGGGALVMMNPEPLAAFFDLFLVGEAEAMLEEFLRRWGKLRRQPRSDIVAALAEMDGAYAPGLRTHRVWTREGDGVLRADAEISLSPSEAIEQQSTLNVATIKWSQAAEGTTSGRLPREAQFQESFLMEVARGCTRRCRFCLAGRIYQPLRVRPAERLITEARLGARPGETIGLLALCAGDYRDLTTLTARLREMGLRIAISSLPADFSARGAAEQIVRSGTSTLTIAPETGSDRLRAVVGKRVTNEKILATVRMLGEVGVQKLRAYFLIGLPFEEPADALAIANLLGEMRGALPLAASLSATINPFVPKPRTPFERAPMAPPERLRAAAARIARSAPWGVRLRVKSLREARLQAALSRGDAQWGARLLRMARGEPIGAILKADGWSLADLTGEIVANSRLPWDFLCDERERRSLRREWRAAVAAARGAAETPLVTEDRRPRNASERRQAR